MDFEEGTPVVRKYPQRIRKKVKYEEFELSLEEGPQYKRKSKKDIDDSCFSEQEDKENDNTNEVEEEVVEEEISEYEKMRLKNLEENKRIMMELGLIDPKKETKVNLRVQAKPKVSKPRTKAPKIIEPTKRSLRLLRKTPEGKDLQLNIFQDTPPGTPPIQEKEETLRIEEEELPMGKDSEEIDFLDSLKVSLSQDSGYCSLESTENLIQDMRDLKFAAIQKVNPNRIQSMCMHPMEHKLLVVSGSTHGELGLWDMSAGELGQFTPHVRPINCVSVNIADNSQLFTSSFDGTLRRADINKSIFHMVYKTDGETNMSHLTWHTQIDASSLLVAHGTGDAGVVDLRVRSPQRWFNCHERSIRTLHLHPTKPHYFLTSSGIGESKIFDLRGGQKEVSEWVSCLTGPVSGKSLTSAFFSPDGNRVVTTCNDDYIHIYDTSNLSEPKDIHRTMHDNHTGRWLSVFKTIWHPQSSDIMFVGSMLHPRRVQIMNGSGKLMRELKADELSTVTPVLAYHSSLPVLVGGNSTGKVHVFTTPSWADRLLKQQEL